MPSRSLIAVWVAVGACIASAGWLAHLTATRTGATFDEPFYVAKGLESWRTGSNRVLMTAGTMPLPVDVQTLPIYLWERARGTPFHPVNDFAQLMPIARAANLPFFVLLIITAARWGHTAGGAEGAVFAAAFTAFDPTVLAHAALATTDIAAAATVLAASHIFYTNRTQSFPRRVLWPGVGFAVALCAKASALAFGPILFLSVGLVQLSREQSLRHNVWSATRPLRRDLVSIGLIGLVGLLAYCGSDWAAEPSFVAWAETLPEGRLKPVIEWVAHHLRVFPNGLEGLVQQIKHNSRGHGAYVLGEYHPRAVWFYFPVALSAKLPVAVLLLAAFTVLARPRSLLTPVGVCGVALVLFSLTCRVQIGVRLVLPLIVLVSVWIGTAWPPTRAGVAVRGLAWLLACAEVFAAGPGELGFANRFYGGPSRVRAILADSNADWGQGLPELARWHAASSFATEPIFVWYYGADPAILLTPFQVRMAHTWPDATPDRLTAETRTGVLAVSFSLLDACPVRRPEVLQLLDWLKSQPEVSRTRQFVIVRLR